jgi:Putative adhesin
MIETEARKTTELPLTRGRLAALAVGVPLCLALTGWGGLNIVAQVGQGHFPVSHTFPASAGRLTVSVSGGDILLQQVAGGQAKLVGTAHYSLVRPDLTQHTTADSATFGYGCVLPVGNCGLNATMSVPPRAAVTASTGGGSVRAVGTTGDVTLSTDGGDVTADKVAGDLHLTTGGGSIRATAVTAPQVTAGTGGGDIEIMFTGVPQNVRVSTGGGSITIVVPGSAQYHVITSTGGGSVSNTVPTDTTSQNVITATSGGGDITIRQGTSL